MARAGLGAALLPMRRLVVGGAVGAVDRSLGLGRVEYPRPLALHGAAMPARAAIVTEERSAPAPHVVARLCEVMSDESRRWRILEDLARLGFEGRRQVQAHPLHLETDAALIGDERTFRRAVLRR